MCRARALGRTELYGFLDGPPDLEGHLSMTRRSRTWGKRFLATPAKSRNVSCTAKSAKVGRQTVYDQRKDDPDVVRHVISANIPPKPFPWGRRVEDIPPGPGRLCGRTSGQQSRDCPPAPPEPDRSTRIRGGSHTVPEGTGPGAFTRQGSVPPAAQGVAPRGR